MKNPYMSIWLSAANSFASAGRGMWAAEYQRQQTAMMKEMTEQWVRWCTGAWMLPGGDPEARAKRRS